MSSLTLPFRLSAMYADSTPDMVAAVVAKAVWIHGTSQADCGKPEVETSKQPVALATTTGLSVASRTCLATMGSAQPAHSRWPSVSLTGLSDISFIEIKASPPGS